MNDRTEKFFTFVAVVAWYTVAVGAVVAVCESPSTTLGSSIAAAGGIIWSFILLHAIVSALGDD